MSGRQVLRPEEIEKESFAAISKELGEMGISLSEEEAPVTMRVIHATADFDYAKTLFYGKGAISIAKDLLFRGADIVTDTDMALAGIHKKTLGRLGGRARCFMAEEETARMARERGETRAAVSMERASRLPKETIFAIGNAPTALMRLCEMAENGVYMPAFVIGVPVGFVNVVDAKERLMESGIPCIVSRGRKGGSGVAAAICNALLYQVGER